MRKPEKEGKEEKAEPIGLPILPIVSGPSGVGLRAPREESPMANKDFGRSGGNVRLQTSRGVGKFEDKL